MGDRYVGDLAAEVAKYESQLQLLSSQIHKVVRQLARTERLADRAYRKNSKAKHGMKWIRRHDKYLIKQHQLQREYEHLDAQRNSARRYVVQLRAVVENQSVSSRQDGRSAATG